MAGTILFLFVIKEMNFSRPKTRKTPRIIKILEIIMIRLLKHEKIPDINESAPATERSVPKLLKFCSLLLMK